MRSVSFALLLLGLALGSTLSAKGKSSGYKPLEQPPTGAQVVKIGFYPVTIHDIDQTGNSCYIDMYVWLRWKGEIDPYPTLEFTNLIGEAKEKPFNKPEEMPDGSKYHLVRIEGRFVQALAGDPLGAQKISVWVEDSIHGADKLTYVVDMGESVVGDLVKAPGWELKGCDSKLYLHEYGSGFGANGALALPSTFAAAEFGIRLSRPKSVFFWKLLPVLLVVATAFMAFILDPKLTAARMALPVTGLFVLLFLQQMSSQPGVVTFLDRIHLAAGLLTIWVLLRIVRGQQAR